MYKIIEYKDKYKKSLKNHMFEIIIEEYGLKYFNEHLEMFDVKNVFKGNSFFIIAVNEDDKVIGSAGVIIDDKIAHMEKLYVNKNFRGTGISKVLYENIIAKCKEEEIKELFLGTYAKFDRAVNFYKKNGFEIYSKKTNEHGDECIYFKKNI